MQHKVVQVGSLSVCIVDDGAPQPQALVVLCHGYGAPGEDLVGLADEWVRQRPALARVRFAFPSAPIALDDAPFSGRAWWHIDVNRFARATMTGDVESLHQDTPDGIADARKALTRTIQALQLEAGHVPCVVGGFSQGSMLAIDYALRSETAPDALLVFSGTVLSEASWRELAAKRNTLPIVVCHGTSDPILPYKSAERLRDLLNAGSDRVRFHAFRGGHTIDATGLALGADLIEQAMKPL